MRYTLGDGITTSTPNFSRRRPAGPRRCNKLRRFELDATEANPGIVVLKLRHLNAPLHEAWIATIPAEDSGLGGPVTDLRIPNPVSFIV